MRVMKRVLHTSLERKCANRPGAEAVSEAGSWREAYALGGSHRANPGIQSNHDWGWCVLWLAFL